MMGWAEMEAYRDELAQPAPHEEAEPFPGPEASAPAGWDRIEGGEEVES